MERREFIQSALAAAAIAQSPTLAYAAKKHLSYRPSEKAQRAVLAYDRLAFGPRPSDLVTFEALGKSEAQRFANLVESQLHPSEIIDTACDEKIRAAALMTLERTTRQLWQDHFVAANQLRDSEKQAMADKKQSADKKDVPKNVSKDEHELRMVPIRDVEKATWIRAVYSERQLNEVLVQFWHDHFNVFGWDNQTSPVFVSYDRDVIRPHALGNFREMLEAVATSPAMLFYLDGFINQSGNPNENYARELFELHTLGAENYLGTKDRTQVQGFHAGMPVGYVDGDVYEAARCFTGWRVETGGKTAETGEFSYFDPWHDRFQKVVLGHSLSEYQSPMKDGRDVLDLLCKHPGTARFIARKLCVRFVSDSPSAELIRKVAQVFHDERSAKDQIRRTLRVIFLSEEFKSSGQQKFKRPFEFVVSSLRACEAEFNPTDKFLNATSGLGQRLFQWRTPDGYPMSREKWLGASAMIDRWRFCNQLANENLDGVKLDWSKLNRDGDSIDLLFRKSLNRAPSESTLKAITRSLNSVSEKNSKGFTSKKRAQYGLSLALMSPEFQWK